MARPKLPEKTRQEIFAHWVQTNNYLQTSKAFGCTANTIKNIVKEMPEYYAREHEHQRQQFVREAWHLARVAPRAKAKASTMLRPCGGGHWQSSVTCQVSLKPKIAIALRGFVRSLTRPWAFALHYAGPRNPHCPTSA